MIEKIKQLTDAVRELRVIALFAAIWIAWHIVYWVTSVPPDKLGGAAVATIYGATAALIAGVAALAKRPK